MTDIYIGLDGEMTGGDLQPPGQKPHFQRFQLIEIGLAILDDLDNRPDHFVSRIGYDKIEYTQEAMDIHKITEEEIKAAPRPAAVDAAAVRWLDERGIHNRATPVGFSVGSFDMPFVREYLPNLGRRISMRVVDLNAVVFAISEVMGRSYKAVKNAGKNYAHNKIAQSHLADGIGPHNAGYDALVAIYSWDFFRKMLVVREMHDHF